LPGVIFTVCSALGSDLRRRSEHPEPGRGQDRPTSWVHV